MANAFVYGTLMADEVVSLLIKRIPDSRCVTALWARVVHGKERDAARRSQTDMRAGFLLLARAPHQPRSNAHAPQTHLLAPGRPRSPATRGTA